MRIQIDSDKQKLIVPVQKLLIALGCLCLAIFVSGTTAAAGENEVQQLPDKVYADIEYIFSVSGNEGELDPGKITEVVDLVRSAPTGTAYSLTRHDNSEGAFYAFEINRRFSEVIGYSFNPDVPTYMVTPSSLQARHWLTPDTERELRRLTSEKNTIGGMQVLRGQESETITPDIHTGGYYTYEQDRFLYFLPGPDGLVIISVSLQNDKSEIGRKGCVVGDDRNWDYLYSEKTGLTKTGLGWVDSFMYRASSITVYVDDPASGTMQMGTFKWLNAGWSRLNMVKSHHILSGMKRFAKDFKTILESPNLPAIEEIGARHEELKTMQEQELRVLVAPYLEELHLSQKIEACSRTFASLVSSGEYLAQMDNQELIRILLLEYLKGHLDGTALENVGFHATSEQSAPIDS